MMLEALRIDGRVLQTAHPFLQRDQDFILAAIEENDTA